jgi:hypothetical protein
MALSLYDEIDWVGPVASIGGWHDVVEAARKDRSSLKAFVEHGYTEEPAQLRADITAFLKAHPGLRNDVRSTLTNLRDLLKENKLGSQILSDSLIVEPTTKTGKKRNLRSKRAGSTRPKRER